MKRILAGMVTLLVLGICLGVRAAEPVEKTGVVGIVGNVPFTKVTFIDSNDSQTYELVGYWRDELARLGGVKVRILALDKSAKTKESNTNSKGASAALVMPVLEVLEYEIVDVGGGVKPFVGFLHKDGNKLVLHVSGFPEPIKILARGKVRKKLETLLGAKVWIAGKLVGGSSVRPMRFAAISKPSKAKGDGGIERKDVNQK